VTGIDQNDWMEYDLLAADSGNYQMDMRIAALSQAARIGLVIDGSISSILDLPVTGGWQNWETISTEIMLKRGLQKLKIFAFIGGYNLNWIEFSNAVSINEEAVIPDFFHFYQNYPNPFNPETTFTYVLPVRSRVILTIFDSKGYKVDSLLNDIQDNGIHELKWNGSSFSSGIYIVRLQAGEYQSSSKIVLLK